MATGQDHDPHGASTGVDAAHAGPDEHDGHDGRDGHAGQGIENPRWVLAPLVVGLVLGVILLVILGIDGGVPAFTD